MAKEALTGVIVTIGGTDYSSQISSVGLPITVDELDSTNFAGTGWKEMVAGLKGGQFTLNLKKDSDLSGLDAAMWTALGTSVAITVQKEAGTLSTSIPQFQFNVIISNWDSINGAVGALHENSVTWPITGAVTRDVTP